MQQIFDQHTCASLYNVSTASWTGELSILKLVEAQSAVLDDQRFNVVRDQKPFYRDILLQSTGWTAH